MTDRTSIPSRVIIADEHPLFRAALGSLLRESSDLEVVAEAADGWQALELCVRAKPDLVLMDIHMPKVDGLEATRAIKRESPSTNVLVLNGYGDPDRLAEAFEAGTSGYIRKSATPQQIIDAVREALEGAFPVDQEIATQLLLRLMGKSRKAPPSPHSQKRPPGGGEHTAAALPASLTRRELEVLQLVAQGRTNRQIARTLLVSTSTVKKHMRHIISKLEASDRTQAAVKAYRMGLLGVREEGITGTFRGAIRIVPLDPDAR